MIKRSLDSGLKNMILKLYKDEEVGETVHANLADNVKTSEKTPVSFKMLLCETSQKWY